MAEWIAAQPLDLIEWTIIYGGVYTEMLSVVFRPKILESGLHIFGAPIGDGYVPFVDLASYGHYTRWIFDNPEKSVGKIISLPTYPTSLKEVAEAFTRATGKPAIAKDITQDEWFDAAAAYVSPDVKLPRIEGSSNENDDTRFTFRQSFGAWWNIWSEIFFVCEYLSFRTDYDAEALRPEGAKLKPGYNLADEIHPKRIKSVEEWMRSSGYTGASGSLFALTLTVT